MRVTQRRVADLEHKVDVLTWLRAELMYSMKAAVAAQVVKARKRALVEQLVAGKIPPNGGLAPQQFSDNRAEHTHQ